MFMFCVCYLSTEATGFETPLILWLPLCARSRYSLNFSQRPQRTNHFVEPFKIVLQSASKGHFPVLRKLPAKIISPGTYDDESSFSAMKRAKPRLRANLSDRHLTSTMKLMCSNNWRPDINCIIENKRLGSFSSSRNSRGIGESSSASLRIESDIGYYHPLGTEPRLVLYLNHHSQFRGEQRYQEKDHS